MTYLYLFNINNGIFPISNKNTDKKSPLENIFWSAEKL